MKKPKRCKSKKCKCDFDEAFMRVLQDDRTIVNQIIPGGISTDIHGKLLKNDGITVAYELEIGDVSE